jgi:hypothetical protein
MSNSAATKVAWARMSRPPILLTCPGIAHELPRGLGASQVASLDHDGRGCHKANATQRL